MKKPRRSLLNERLAKTAALLERLEQTRLSHANPNLGKSIEEGIIWDELLDLELQEFEEEMKRQSEVAHSLVPDAGTMTQASGDIPQQPQRQSTSSRWWRLGRFLR